MKRRNIALSIVLLGVFLLTASTVSYGGGWEKLQKKFDPEGKDFWVVIANKEIGKVCLEELERHKVSARWRCGFGFLHRREGHIINSGYPVIVAFSPDQVDLEKIPEKYHFLFALSIDKLEKILAETKSVIVSQKVRIDALRQIPDEQGRWVIVSKTEEEGSQTLIAAPNKESLKKAITRFFSLSEVPLEPIIFVPE